MYGNAKCSSFQHHCEAVRKGIKMAHKMGQQTYVYTMSIPDCDSWMTALQQFLITEGFSITALHLDKGEEPFLAVTLF